MIKNNYQIILNSNKESYGSILDKIYNSIFQFFQQEQKQ